MATAPRPQTDPALVLGKALFNVQSQLGLTDSTLAQIIGVDRTTISRMRKRGTLEASSKQGELATYLIRLYRALFVLVGGDAEALQHWMDTPNHHLNGRPADLITSVQGLIRVMEYADAIRGKV